MIWQFILGFCAGMLVTIRILLLRNMIKREAL